MSEATYVPCPHCGHPYPMTVMQKELYRGRTLSCNNCAKQFSVENLTPVPMPSARTWNVARPAGPPAAPGTATPPGGAAAPAARPKMRGWMVAAVSLGGAVLLVLLLVLVLLPPLNRAREQARRVECAGRMRQIGQAMLIYANASAGQFPDALEKLLLYAPASAFVCPSCGDTPAPGATPQIQAQNLTKGGHLSYAYAGSGLKTGGATVNLATTIVLYEPLANHNDGINVLYADGSVAFLPRNAAIGAITALQAPPTVPPVTTRPSTQPADAALESAVQEAPAPQ